jgi:hypothetical protein
LQEGIEGLTELSSWMLIGGAISLELQYLLVVGGSNTSAAGILWRLIGGDDCDSTSETSEEGNGAEAA